MKKDANDEEDVFIPEYFDVYTSLEALDFKLDEHQYPGFQLINIR